MIKELLILDTKFIKMYSGNNKGIILKMFRNMEIYMVKLNNYIV
jgi:hypothetical protein